MKTGGANENVTTGAGTFKDSKKTFVTTEIKAAILTFTINGDYWFTYAVPILYYAKSNQETSVIFKTVKIKDEVIGFGMTGAKSYFFKFLAPAQKFIIKR